MFCPKCGDEFQSGFSRCPDCETALVEDWPSASRSTGLAALRGRLEVGRLLRSNWVLSCAITGAGAALARWNSDAALGVAASKTAEAIGLVGLLPGVVFAAVWLIASGHEGPSAPAAFEILGLIAVNVVGWWAVLGLIDRLRNREQVVGGGRRFVEEFRRFGRDIGRLLMVGAVFIAVGEISTDYPNEFAICVAIGVFTIGLALELGYRKVFTLSDPSATRSRPSELVCPRCQREFPSRYHFGPSGACIECVPLGPLP